MMFIRGWKESVKKLFCGHLGWALSLFLIGLGSKFLLIFMAGSPLPYYDQWEGEAVDMYVPYFEHVLKPVDLFKPHNEHRIFFTRIYDFALLLLNGQWDSRLQMTLNACLHCGAIAGFGWLMAGLLGKSRWPLIWLPLAAAVALPYGWENTLWGFQSQFYFLLIFSLLTMWLLGVSEPLSQRWKLGVLLGALALFTMASGFIAAASVVPLCLMDMLKDRKSWRKQMPTLIVCAVLIVAGVLLKADVQRHHGLQAHSASDLVLAWARNVAWPWPYQPWLALLNLLVFGILAWVCWRAPSGQPIVAERMLLLTGIWAMLQSLATAYARGAGGNAGAWRYMDTTSLLMIANWIGIVALITRHRAQLRPAPVYYAIFTAWTAVSLGGFWHLTHWARTDPIPGWIVRQQIRLQTTRAFMATDNEKEFDIGDEKNLAFPYAPELVFLLREKDIRRLLPSCVREPLKVLPDGTNDGAFVMNGTPWAQREPPYEKCWGSFSSAGAGARGKFESLPVKPSAMAYLEIPVAGDLSEAGTELSLVESGSGKVTAVKLPQPPGARWVSVFVKAPTGEFKVVARDESDTKWFAFKEPCELGWLSYWALRTLGAWKYFIGAGVVCFVLSAAGLFISSRRMDGAVNQPMQDQLTASKN